MNKNYQTKTSRARTGRTTPKKARPDAGRAAHEAAIALPDTVTVAIAELAGELEEGLLAFVVGTGLKVLDVVLEGRGHRPGRGEGPPRPRPGAVRHGSDAGLVTLGGRQVPIRRPRLRSADRSAEVALPTYQLASSTELLGREAMARMLAKLSTRRYGVGPRAHG
jgi:putative transposase